MAETMTREELAARRSELFIAELDAIEEVVAEKVSAGALPPSIRSQGDFLRVHDQVEGINAEAKLRAEEKLGYGRRDVFPGLPEITGDSAVLNYMERRSRATGEEITVEKSLEPETPVIVNAAPYTGWVGYVARPKEMEGVERYEPHPGDTPVRMLDAEGHITRHWFDRRDLITLPGRS